MFVRPAICFVREQGEKDPRPGVPISFVFKDFPFVSPLVPLAVLAQWSHAAGPIGSFTNTNAQTRVQRLANRLFKASPGRCRAEEKLKYCNWL